MEYALYVVLNIFSFVILLIILSISFFTKGKKRNAENIFMMMEFSMLMLLFSDSMIFTLVGRSWALLPLKFFWGLTYVLSTLVITLFHFYAVAFLRDYKKLDIPLHKTYYIIVSIVINAVWLIALPFGLYTKFDAQGNFQNTSFHLYSQLGYGLLLSPDILMVYKNRKVIGNKRVSWALFLSVTLVTRILDLILHVSMIFPMMTLSLVFIYDTLNQETDMALKEQAIALQKQEKELQVTREKIVISQIQPHFLYNVLNTICILCRKNPDLAAKTTADFATYLRMNLNFLSVDTPVLFDEEQRHTEIYLSLEQLRFGDDMSVVWDIQTRSFTLPVLTLQPIVENAVKHGICQKENGGTVWISTREERDAFVVIVKDDGVGFDTRNLHYEDGKTHIGMENTRRRLAVISKATMTVESTIGKGTTVTIRVPKEAKS
ncbi:MAG: histidine kinase [Spirochaetales bacterium]|nr:histidine kinase [Candidatus Physcosoma equi]